MQFSQVLFLWNFSRQWKYIIRNSHYSQSYVFFSSHVWMWELDYKEGWALKNSCFWTVVFEKTRESLGLQGDQTSQSWRKSTLNINWKDWCWNWNSNPLATWCKEPTLGKDPDAVYVGRQKEKGLTEDEMVGWHHWLNGHKFEQALGDGEGHGSLARCSPLSCKESDMTEQLNNNNNTIGSTYV